VIWLLGRLIHQSVLRNAGDGAGDHGNCPVVEGREAHLCPVTDAYAFDVDRRNMGLHDELILIGRDIENWLALADHGADGEHPQVLNAAGHRRDDVKAAENVLSDDKFAPQIAQLLPRIDEIFASLLQILLLRLLYLQFCFADAFFGFGVLRNGLTDIAGKTRALPLQRQIAGLGDKVLIIKCANAIELVDDEFDLFLVGGALAIQSLHLLTKLISARAKHRYLCLQSAASLLELGPLLLHRLRSD